MVQFGQLDQLYDWGARVMTKRISAARAKAQLPSLMAEVAYGGECYVIERRGKPLAALVSLDKLERIEREGGVSARPLGALALAGAWRDVEDRDLEAIVDEIYSERERDAGRPVDLEG